MSAFRSLKTLTFVLYFLLFGANAYADTQITAVPTSWRLQNYAFVNLATAAGVVLWFTGSSCVNGQLTLPSAATTDDKNRLFSLILAAKTSGKSVFVSYDTTITPGYCTITTFGMDS